MLTETEAREFAHHWMNAWNSHNLDAVMSHYSQDVVLTSPVAANLLKDPEVKGKAALRAYFKRGLEAYPNLVFELQEVLWRVSSVVLYYLNHRGTKTAEFMEFDAEGKVVRVVANYSA